jgi:hypothetical protein
MRKYLVYAAVILNWLSLVSWQAPDYRPTVAHIYERLTDEGKVRLTALLGNRSIEDLAAHMDKAARDTIKHYARPIDRLRLGGPYNYSQLDSVLRPLHLDFVAGFNRFEHCLKDQKLPNKDRAFALQVLIGLVTTWNLPLHVTHILPREEFLKHDIFLDILVPEPKVEKITDWLYWAYTFGVRVKQAGSNKKMVHSYINVGYSNATNHISTLLDRALTPANEMIEDGSMIIRRPKPEEDPIVRSAFATFVGGWKLLDKFLNDNLVYPAEEWNKGIEGECFVKVLVEKDGTVSRVSVGIPVSPGIDSEVVRVLRLSPKWKPGVTIFGKGVIARSEVMVKAIFRIRPGVKREDAFHVSVQENIKP